ncbi:uncharacterized protein LOC143808951 [Ranitomeya variabilis]|uniref:uncharacterized protein LOC143808951 n=1 Tax=Ranitomeya variabilis TaxID=490064 RepID=UPI004055A0A3
MEKLMQFCRIGTKPNSDGKLDSCTLVATREGKSHIKQCKKLMKLCGMPEGGRLQPLDWKLVLKERKGILEDNGLLSTARAWERVSESLYRENWIEEERKKRGRVLTYVYYKNISCERPPPYNGGSEPCGKCNGRHFVNGQCVKCNSSQNGGSEPCGKCNGRHFVNGQCVKCNSSQNGGSEPCGKCNGRHFVNGQCVKCDSSQNGGPEPGAKCNGSHLVGGKYNSDSSHLGGGKYNSDGSHLGGGKYNSDGSHVVDGKGVNSDGSHVVDGECAAPGGEHLRLRLHTTSPNPCYPVMTTNGQYYIPSGSEQALPMFPISVVSNGAPTLSSITPVVNPAVLPPGSSPAPTLSTVTSTANLAAHPHEMLQAAASPPNASTTALSRSLHNPMPSTSQAVSQPSAHLYGTVATVSRGGSMWEGDTNSTGSTKGRECWQPIFEKELPEGPLLVVGKGDITTMETDAIVNAANSRLEHNGGVARAIVEAGGATIQADSHIIVESRGQIAVGDIAVTKAGNLPCRMIIHAVTPTYDPIHPDVSAQQLRAAITRILEYANISEHIETLTIPAIGVGIFGFPVHACTREIVEIIINKCSPPSICCLSEIRLISNEDRTVKAFKTACITWTPHHDTGAAQIEPLIPGLLPPPAPHKQGITSVLAVPSLLPPQVPPPTVPMLMSEEPTLYVKFTPQQAATLLNQLPDPEKQPMPFYRSMLQIQRNYSATWQDLISLANLKAGDAYWPVMEAAFNDASLASDTTWDSGILFCQQLKTWASDKLADQSTSFKDVTQEPGESVERYHARLAQMFNDLGFSNQIKVQRTLLVSSFVEGLREALRKQFQAIRPEYATLDPKDVLTIAKGFEKTLPEKLIPSNKKTHILWTDVQYQNQQLLSPRSKDVCFNCGNPGHRKRDCRVPFPRRRFRNHNDDNRRFNYPRYNDQYYERPLQAQMHPDVNHTAALMDLSTR